MIGFDDALSLVLQTVRGGLPPGVERVLVGQAAGRVLAEDVLSPVDIPTKDHSAMDGYALTAADLSADEPTCLPVVGVCQTGHEAQPVNRGACVRIFTGAQLPPGTDTVIIQENVAREGDSATFAPPFKRGSHIRRAGEDLRSGERVISSGTRLTPFQLGLLSTVERTEVLVARRPRVAILCTGDELRAPGSTFFGGQLAESNSVALAALVSAVGGEPVRGPLVTDELEVMKAAIERASRGADVLLTVGGISVGDHDVVRPALEALGAEVLFHRVRIKPGKPVLFAKLGRCFVLGLPGNPSSAQVNFSVLGAPLVRALQGDEAPVPRMRWATMRSSFRQKPGRRGFYPARVEGDEVEIESNQSSGASTSVAWANCFVVVGEQVTELAAGESVQVLAYVEL